MLKVQLTLIFIYVKRDKLNMLASDWWIAWVWTCQPVMLASDWLIAWVQTCQPISLASDWWIAWVKRDKLNMLASDWWIAWVRTCQPVTLEAHYPTITIYSLTIYKLSSCQLDSSIFGPQILLLVTVLYLFSDDYELVLLG